MRIGPESWNWVSIDTAGVPSGGAYGDIQGIAPLLEEEGWKLAWSELWHHFTMYQEMANGHIIVHANFCNWSVTDPDTGEPAIIPLRVEHVETFKMLREKHPDAPTIEHAMKQQVAKEKYDKAVARQQAIDDRADEVERAVSLTMGDEKKLTIVVPERQHVVVG